MKCRQLLFWKTGCLHIVLKRFQGIHFYNKIYTDLKYDFTNLCLWSACFTQGASDITPDYPELKQLIQDMFQTLDNSNGVGLAAPQIVRLFVLL